MLDYIIVGQGIAGSMLAHFLAKRHKNFHIIDDFSQASSTSIAIGTCNPITGNNFVKTWLADAIFPFAQKTYFDLEKQFGRKLFYPKPIYRIFPDEKRRSKWLKKAATPAFANYVAPAFDEEFADWLYNPLGGINILHGGYVDTVLLLACFREKFLQTGELTNAHFDYSELQLTGQFIQWRERRARRIIFCEGAAAQTSPLFHDLPFAINKGQFITLQVEGMPSEHIIKKKCMILPVGDGTFKIGATYESNYADLEPTKAGRDELHAQVRDTMRLPFSIIDQNAGLRPASIDRKPLIGLHHKERRAGIFNGFGAKGLTLAPWFAQHFVHHLEAGAPLSEEVTIANYLQRTVRNRA